MSELYQSGFLAECEREQLHRAQSIQPWGCLLGGRAGDPTIRFGSANLADWLGCSFTSLQGRLLTAILPDFPPKTELSDIAGDPDAWMYPAAGKRLYPDLVIGPRGALDGLLSCNENDWLLELEEAPPVSQRSDAYRPVPHRLYRMPYTEHDWTAHCQYLADEMRAASGFERVMIYRFREDGCGEVISESRVEGLPPYLGLRYPASDIPRIARDLYRLNWHRQIPDVGAGAVPVLTLDAGESADLSLSDLRAVSPVHLEYLRNMGVTASLSFSILLAGELWGLVACHHSSPRHLPLPVRERFAEMTQVFTLAVAGYQSTRRLLELNESDQEITKLIESLRRVDADLDLRHELDLEREEASKRLLGQALLSLVRATGAALVDGSRVAAFGATPEQADITAMTEWLRETVSDPIFATDRLSAHFPEALALSSLASGLLAVRITGFQGQGERFFLWWRPEQPQTVHWAGDPRKSALFDAQRQILSPRSSFARWVETSSRQSEPWSDADLLRAKKFRSLVLRDVNASILGQ